MRILKIELQNINSLKSDTPIVIDFEKEQFKDVGLYAITGSTGAGKTTILDAITIALYHNVPRFNGTKGALIDVVSYGASHGFSRVTFENENTIYEAYWGIRLVSGNGKKLQNPQEEVSLKNLTTNEIFASQKTALKIKIIEVTQLNYDQFLRSVMLAQGEFASFLTAKGSEKGRLLEQITGEQIYKKIGLGISDRKTEEEKTLKEIQNRINSEDVLSEEQKITLAQKDKELDVEITTSEKEIITNEVIVNWYTKFKELTSATEKIAKDFKEVDVATENHKSYFQLLDLNEKAEPYKELILSFNRNEKASVEKSNQLKQLEEALQSLEPQIKLFTETSENDTKALAKAEEDFNTWLPKFEKITALEGQLKSEVENKAIAVKIASEIQFQITDFEKEQETLKKVIKETATEVEKNEAFVLKNAFLKEVALKISNWTTGLTTLKAHKETLVSNVSVVRQKNKDLESANVEFSKNKKDINKKKEALKVIEKEIDVIKSQLSKDILTDLLTEQKELSLKEVSWKMLKDFSEEIIKKEKEQQVVVSEEKIKTKEFVSVQTQLVEAKKEIKIKEVSVADAVKILDLEKSIANYEYDRQRLVVGEPCGLCGSKEHPFAEDLPAIGVSKSELELQNRKQLLKTLVDTESKLKIQEGSLITSIANLKKQASSISVDLKTNISKITALGFDTDTINSDKITTELNVLYDKTKIVDEKIIVVQQIQKQKDMLSDGFTKQNQVIESLRSNEAGFNQKIKSITSEIKNTQKSIDELRKVSTTLESDLKIKLTVFKYELPSVENTNSFITSIETDINTYNETSKRVVALKGEQKVFETRLEAVEKQLLGQVKVQEENQKIVSKCETKCTELRNNRIKILPTEITLESKRVSLQLAKKELTDKVTESKKELQKGLDTKTEKQTLKKQSEGALKGLKTESNELQISLNTVIEKTDFDSKEAIGKALLTQELKLKYTENKERIKARKIQLDALKEENIKAIAVLNDSKKFTATEEESKLVLATLKKKKDTLSAEKGKISEAFRKNKEIRDRNKEIYKKIDEQEAVCNIWRELYKIIGNTKDAFNIYVQRLTLKHLLDFANVHLYKLNKRYSLKMEDDYKSKEELDFVLIDHFQTNQTRLVDTSSGGEKFIISLALALGLSDLASKNVKIDSLFIDEGFGTLDKGTLETVISTLETLQSQGKMIGIISHVENLKERIATQIQITKKSNGISVVDIL